MSDREPKSGEAMAPAGAGDSPPKRRSVRVQVRLADAFHSEDVKLRQWLDAARSKRNTFFRPTDDEWPLLVERVGRHGGRLQQLGRLLELQLDSQTLHSVDHAVRELAQRVIREACPELLRSSSAEPSAPAAWAAEVRRLGGSSTAGQRGLDIVELLVRYAGLVEPMNEDGFVEVVKARGDIRMLRAPEGGGTSGREVARGEDTTLRRLIFGKLGNAASLALVLSARAAMQAEVVHARSALASSQTTLEMAKHRIAALEEVGRADASKREALESKLSARDQHIEQLENAVAATKREGNHSTNQVRGRMRGALEGEYRNLLQTALAASTDEPPSMGVVRERLERALERIVRDVEWLDSLA